MHYINLISEWGKDHFQIFQLTDAILFLLFFVAVVYLLIFACAALSHNQLFYPKAKKQYSIQIIVPCTHNKEILKESILNFLKLDYDPTKYRITIVGNIIDETLKKFSSDYPIDFLELGIETSKIGMIQQVIHHIDESSQKPDLILLLESNNLIDADMLQKINDAYYAGCNAIQTHRIAKHRQTSMEILDAVSEEINNSIFRKGHTKLGLSSALIGSGMAFDYQLFRQIMLDAKGYDIDKYLERALLKRNVFIEYLESVFIYDDKVKNEKVFYQQRTTWIGNRFWNLYHGIFYLPIAFFQRKLDYCDKLFQWMMPSRIVLLGSIILFALISTLINWVSSIKWWGLLLLLAFTFILAIPSYLVDDKFRKALSRLPILFFLMLGSTIHFNRAFKKK